MMRVFFLFVMRDICASLAAVVLLCLLHCPGQHGRSADYARSCATAVGVTGCRAAFVDLEVFPLFVWAVQ